MKSAASPNFWAKYHALPAEVRRLADKVYRLWQQNPRHPSLQFKPIRNDLWSIRIGAHYRAIGKFLDNDAFMWLWIGTHEEYNKL